MKAFDVHTDLICMALNNYKNQNRIRRTTQ